MNDSGNYNDFFSAFDKGELPMSGKSPDSKSYEPPAEGKAIAKSVARLNWNYYDTLDKSGNIFYSPYSIATALSILANGASDVTRDELMRVLDIDSVSEWNKAYLKQRAYMKQEYVEGRLLLDSNLLLLAEDCMALGVNGDFRKAMTDIYLVDIQSADFRGNLNAVKKNISAWVDSRTNHFITGYQADISEKTVMGLMNVVYFKGAWEIPFGNLPLGRLGTEPEPFTDKDGYRHDVQMMNKTFGESVRYYEDEKFKGIALSYMKDGSHRIVSMYLVLPMDPADLHIADEWSRETPEYRTGFLSNIQSSGPFCGEVYVKLPKFEMDGTNPLEKSLSRMGLTELFTGGANFSNIVGTQLILDRIGHQAKIKVDEKGTEAVTMTGGFFSFGLPPEPPPRKEFYCDIPFLLTIRDEASGLDIFTGIVNTLDK